MLRVATSLRWLALCVVALLWSAQASATFHLFVIEQVYSNADGSIQFIVFHQTPASNGEDLWKTHELASIHDGATSTFVFPNNLTSSFTKGKRVLVATQGFAALGIVAPDFVIPNGFVGTGSGNLQCCSGVTFGWGALPTDGVTAINQFGAPTPNLATNFAGATGSVTAEQANSGGPAAATIVEYYNASLDHFFITWITGEIAILDAGTQIKGWTRTGYTFKTFPVAAAGTTPVCRYYIPPDKGNSHFFGRGTVECTATGQKNPTFILEDPTFMHMFLPVLGTCPTATTPVYRVFSNRADANHRYMTDRTVRDLMVGKGWLAEGDGPDLVVMCAPS